jgi:hypothetical protein
MKTPKQCPRCGTTLNSPGTANAGCCPACDSSGSATSSTWKTVKILFLIFLGVIVAGVVLLAILYAGCAYVLSHPN